jgi:hypothetical protein
MKPQRRNCRQFAAKQPKIGASAVTQSQSVPTIVREHD